MAQIVAAPLPDENDRSSDTREQVVGDELLAKAMEASAEDLGTAFLVNRYLVKMTELVGGGLTIHTPQGTIEEDTAPEQRNEFDGRLKTYRDAIEHRGYAKLFGEYEILSVAPSCARSGSLLLGGAREGLFEKFEIEQETFELTLSVKVVLEPGQKDDIGPFDFEGVVVESSLVLEDPVNSDYFVLGRWLSDRIEFKPDPRVLDGWPGWAAPPKRRDLEKCSLTLKPVKHES